MEKQNVLSTLTRIGVIPVVRAEAADNVVRAVEALAEGGIPVAEITMTVPGAIQVIQHCAAHFGDRITLGAGSVTSAGVCASAIDAGSVFIVSPVFKADVIEVCNRRNVCVIAGALTPTEIFSAWEAGADVVKVFPAKAMGGAAYLRMVHEPLPQIPLTPTGGVSLETLADYFKAGVPFVGAGGDLISKQAINSGDMPAITDRARRYVAAIRAARAQTVA
ncbi:MAG: bifunctional 4-hydroxy-2-oxoglutarate aldolase/2-dehydro-3-deoxy-phosphogluconate aldolase [Desulfobacterales bacterium]|jgi:2-dehydro-3-deoxyphosphogluconate aldolase/(4S)-4-hydroxy-2-oxoglutarate aldolase|nr:bifunctional 4-hydroxy-2-oxoglutarate aldolase/2-dehydro-3-deoxy-phosphogluconate aldolase [Desulfobacterales bacterium]